MFARKWSRRTIWIGVGVVVLLVVASSAAMRARSVVAAPPVPFSDLLRHLDRGEVAELIVAGETLEFAAFPVAAGAPACASASCASPLLPNLIHTTTASRIEAPTIASRSIRPREIGARGAYDCNGATARRGAIGTGDEARTGNV